jgi:hypothetical protein
MCNLQAGTEKNLYNFSTMVFTDNIMLLSKGMTRTLQSSLFHKHDLNASKRSHFWLLENIHKYPSTQRDFMEFMKEWPIQNFS